MREELKYVVPEDALDELREEVQPFMQLDKHGVGFENRGYTIRSIYLDSPNLLYYYEKQAHLQNRKKLRIRGYNEPRGNDTVFLEIKRKFTSAIAKDRAPVRYEDLHALFNTCDVDRFVDPTRSFPEAREAARSFFYHVYKSNLRPTNLVVYEREAFMGLFDPTLRITFDRNLRGGIYPTLDELYEEQDFRPVMPGFFILEIKYNTQFPGWLRPALARHGLMQRAASKYCMVIDQFERRQEGRVAVIANSEAVMANGRHETPAEKGGPAEQDTSSSVILARTG